MFKKFLKDESGATLIEYILLVAIISVASIAAMSYVSDSINNVFNSVGDVLVFARQESAIGT